MAKKKGKVRQTHTKDAVKDWMSAIKEMAKTQKDPHQSVYDIIEKRAREAYEKDDYQIMATLWNCRKELRMGRIRILRVIDDLLEDGKIDCVHVGIARFFYPVEME